MHSLEFSTFHCIISTKPYNALTHHWCLDFLLRFITLTVIDTNTMLCNVNARNISALYEESRFRDLRSANL